MLHSEYLSVLEAKTSGDLLDHMVDFGQRLGFERVGAATVIERSGEEPRFVCLDNMPRDYVPLADDAGRMKSDPVVQHCKRSSVPIVWSQETYARHGLGEQWEQQKPFGYGCGIALALHLPHGRHFLFGLNREDALLEAPADLTRAVADAQLFAVHAYEASARLVSMPAVVVEVPALTPRELECLRWTMEGKTAWEVGMLLGISERTAVLHVNNAAHKLDCASKHQAVIKAMRLGLIH
jgi:DNA-binding CsgD family transcriptional regulator